MIERLFRNGMLDSGNARRSDRWRYPTMPRLNRDAYDEVGATCRGPASGRDGVTLWAGCFNVIRKAIRAI